jgi:hypothetical protein
MIGAPNKTDTLSHRGHDGHEVHKERIWTGLTGFSGWESIGGAAAGNEILFNPVNPV